MSMPSMDDLKSSKEQNSSETPDTDSEIPEEIQNAPSLNVRPESAIAFEEIVDVGFTGDVDDEQNLKGEPTTGYGGSVAITVREPTLSGGQLWSSTDDGQIADYRLVGPETTSEWTETVNGEEATLGIEYGQSNYNGERVESFDEEFITVYLSGGLGEYVLRRLDIAGGFSYGDDGVSTSYSEEPAPIMEYPSDESELEGAVRAEPVLRADFRDRAGAFMFELGEDNGAFLASVFMSVEDEDGGTHYVDLDDDLVDSLDHDGYMDSTARYIGTLQFDNHGDASDGDRSASGDTTDDAADTDEVDADSVDDLTMGFADDDDGVTYGDLSDNWQTFVDNVVGGIESGKVDAGKVDVLAKQFEADNDPVSFDGISVEDIEEVVNGRISS